MTQNPQLLHKVESLQNMLVEYATSGTATDSEYTDLRRELLDSPEVSPHLPSLVRNCRNLRQFWAHIKLKFGSYQERRVYLWDQFAPVLEYLESRSPRPADGAVAYALTSLDAEHVTDSWRRALTRRENDPEGAITSSRSLLESVCKLVLDEEHIAYKADADLPSLYSLVSKRLTFAPSEHSEQIFKQILGGCQAVVEGLGAVRNRLGDSHGHGKSAVKPAARHAELAVNLAGSMAVFIVATWRARQQVGT